MQARNLCEELCAVQVIRGAILPDFDSSKYEQIFNITSDGILKILKILQGPVLPQVISKMCEKMFDVQIICSFKREQKMLEQIEKDLVKFLLQTTVDVKDHLKYRSHAESINLPNKALISKALIHHQQITRSRFRLKMKKMNIH